MCVCTALSPGKCPPAPLPPQQQPVTRTYHVPQDRQQQFLQRVHEMFGQKRLQSSVDASSGRVFVNATPDVHQAIADFIRARFGLRRRHEEHPVGGNAERKADADEGKSANERASVLGHREASSWSGNNVLMWGGAPEVAANSRAMG